MFSPASTKTVTIYRNIIDKACLAGTASNNMFRKVLFYSFRISTEHIPKNFQ